MKSLKVLLLVLAAAMIAISCEKKSASDLTGTVWKYNYYEISGEADGKNEGGGLKFISPSIVNAFDWEYERDGQYVEDVFETGTYSYTAPDGVLYMRSGSYLFNINGNTMKLFDVDDIPVITLKRQ